LFGAGPLFARSGMKPMKIYADIGIWRMVFAALIIAVIFDCIGIWMGWIATH
jgi:hypothetical protein